MVNGNETSISLLKLSSEGNHSGADGQKQTPPAFPLSIFLNYQQKPREKWLERVLVVRVQNIHTLLNLLHVQLLLAFPAVSILLLRVRAPDCVALTPMGLTCYSGSPGS